MERTRCCSFKAWLGSGFLHGNMFPQLWQVLEGGPSDNSGAWEGNIMLTPLLLFLKSSYQLFVAAALLSCQCSHRKVSGTFRGLLLFHCSSTQWLSWGCEGMKTASSRCLTCHGRPFSWLIHRYLREISPPASQPFFGGFTCGLLPSRTSQKRQGEGLWKQETQRAEVHREGGMKDWAGRGKEGKDGGNSFWKWAAKFMKFFLHKRMQFLVCLEMKIAGSVALCTPTGIWNFPGYQEKGRTCWRDLEPVHKHVWVHWVWRAGFPSSMSY